MQEFTLKTKHVNSKSVLKDVTDFVEEIIDNFNIMWASAAQRDAILEVLDEHMEDMVEENKIDQWNIICDGRNNKRSNIEKKLTYLDVSYQQRNCFNTTELRYTIKEE